MNDAPSLYGRACLTDRGVIRARGPDAAKFLQGQLTNDVLSLGVDEARLAGFCSAKGRLQASFLVWRGGEEEFLLVCARDLLTATLKRLTMFVLRAKCTLSDATGEVALWGYVGAAVEALAAPSRPLARRDNAPATVIRLADVDGVQRALVAVGAGAAALDEGDAVPEVPLESWRRLDVRSGVVTIEAATVDRFVPQMVNFELVGGVDFKKGCYPGQEVVARSQYRGTTKRRVFLFGCEAAATAGQDVYAGGDASEAAGTVAYAAADSSGGGSDALVEVRLAALAEGQLRLGTPSGPALYRLPLPYALPLEADAPA